ncbi:alpha/beta fold hydrolase [Alteromonas flava]|uniref:alpha/beta fold hydrolase n=1 Tax=Alteromonas flava TaxID=2048003 RepID=UPI0013DCEECC|nr:alpha/beta hydrolase [Alteromonas flava]
MADPKLHPVTFELPHITLAGLSNGRQGKPVLLALHGWLDNANSFVPMVSYFNDFHFIAIDWPGHGHSQHRPLGSEYNQLDYIDDLYQLLVSQEWPSVTLVGHSMGGILASIFAAVFPERVRAVISIDACGPLHSQQTLASIKTGIEQRSKRRTRASRPAPIPFSYAVNQRSAHSDLDKAQIQLLLQRSVSFIEAANIETEGLIEWRTDRRLRNQSLLRLTERQARELVTAIKCPVLLLLAKEGLVYGDKTRSEQLHWFNTATYREVDGGHHCHMQHPEHISREITEFLSTNAA